MKKALLKLGALFMALVLAFVILAGCDKTPDVGDDYAEAVDQYFDENYGNYEITVYLIIGNPDPTKEDLFSGKVKMKTIIHMAYEAVEAACTAKGIEIVGLNGYSSFITSINGVGYEEHEDGTYSAWSTTINGKFSPGIGAQQLREGDLFEIRYVTKEKTW